MASLQNLRLRQIESFLHRPLMITFIASQYFSLFALVFLHPPASMITGNHMVNRCHSWVRVSFKVRNVGQYGKFFTPMAPWIFVPQFNFYTPITHSSVAFSISVLLNINQNEGVRPTTSQTPSTMNHRQIITAVPPAASVQPENRRCL